MEGKKLTKESLVNSTRTAKLNNKYKLKRTKKYDTPDGFPVDIVIFTVTSEKKEGKLTPKRELKVMLIQRRQYNEPREDYPFQGYWAVPGGFSERNETIEEAARRELKEETHIEKEVHLEQFSTIYYPGRDPRGWIPTTVYFALVKEELLKERQAGDDAQALELFSINELREMNLAFDHKTILFGDENKVGNEKIGVLGVIQQKVLTSPIVREFLEEEFTISELREVLTTIVPELELDKGNFYKKMLGSQKRQGIIEEVIDENGEVKKTNRSSKPYSKLFRFTDKEPKLTLYNSTLF